MGIVGSHLRIVVLVVVMNMLEPRKPDSKSLEALIAMVAMWAGKSWDGSTPSHRPIGGLAGRDEYRTETVWRYP